MSDPSAETIAAETAAGRLGRFAEALGLSDLSPEVVEAAKCSLLDAYGCGIAAVALEQCAPMLAWADAQGGPTDRVVARSGREAASTALVTGTLIHALDFDDTHPEAMSHVTAVVGTAAVAVGQALGCSGAEVLTAHVAGNEAAARLGAAASGEWHERGIHPTAACGVFGAALAAGKLMGLDADTLMRALGLAGSTSSGLFEYLADGSQTKPFHAGWAAHAGILAAELAGHGLRGPATVIEGRFGLFGALLGADRSAQVKAQMVDLGERWETLRMSIKPYPTCHLTHAGIEAALGLVAEGVQPADVVSFSATVPSHAVPIVLDPRAPKVAPRTTYDAKFSLPWCVGAAFVDGRVDLETFEDLEHLEEPEILRLATSSEHVVAEGAADAPFFTVLDVRLADGSERRVDVQRPLGTPGRAIRRDGVLEKFERNAGLALADPRRFAEVVLDLEHAPDVTAVALPTGVAVGVTG